MRRAEADGGPAQPHEIPVLILAGGRGERLGAHATVPKPLVAVAGRPFIGYLLEAVWRAGFRRVCCLTGYRADEFPATLESPAALARMPFLTELRLDFRAEPQPRGTGGALRAARELVGDSALVLNGDSYCAVDLLALLRGHREQGTGISLAAAYVADVGDYGALEIGTDDRLRGFTEKGVASAGWINAGVYLASRRFLDAIAPGRVSLEREVLTDWLEREAIWVLRSRGLFRDIGTPQRLARAQQEFPPPDLTSA